MYIICCTTSVILCVTVSESEVSSLFMKFSILDRDGLGLMTRNDFFAKFICEERTFFGDAIFNLIGKAFYTCI